MIVLLPGFMILFFHLFLHKTPPWILNIGHPVGDGSPFGDGFPQDDAASRL